MTDWVTISAEDYRKLIAYVNLEESGELVRVVRCKDCKHRLERNGKFECIYDTGDPFAQGREADNDKWFCADGEKREVQDGS